MYMYMAGELHPTRLRIGILNSQWGIVWQTARKWSVMLFRNISHTYCFTNLDIYVYDIADI